MALALWLLIAIIALIVIIFVGYYNRFVVLSNRIDNSLSQIDVQLKRRADLIPNLMESVKGYMKHEKGIMESVNNARKALVGAKDLPSKMKANNILENALGKLFAIAENYPDLKANTNFLQLQNELTTTEDKIAYSRQFYNDSILSYNNKCKMFPGVFFANMYGFKEKEYIKIAEAERKVVKVKF
ncbi:LemA family protein [Candidatus Pacearchaeota archaeon]|nr:LemA family protein [Candidatus Pacearchaeota archaeon]